jgi:hypothetical protein
MGFKFRRFGAVAQCRILQTPLVDNGDVMRFIVCDISLTMRSFVIMHQMRLLEQLHVQLMTN